MKSIAILLDGGFVRHRLHPILGHRHAEPDDVVRLAGAICTDSEDLFRIYYYDCPPYTGRKTNPLLGEPVNFDATRTARRMKSFQEALAHRPHVAFRRGELDFGGWSFHRRVLEDLLGATTCRFGAEGDAIRIEINLPRPALADKGLLDDDEVEKGRVRAVTEEERERILARALGRLVTPVLRQKRVDMKIGLDVAWLASRRIVDRIALVTTDTDFFPAMKFARREGLQVVLVPLDQRPRPDLVEHADEVRAVNLKPLAPRARP